MKLAMKDGKIVLSLFVPERKQLMAAADILHQIAQVDKNPAMRVSSQLKAYAEMDEIGNGCLLDDLVAEAAATTVTEQSP